jgi:hypothetical protein
MPAARRPHLVLLLAVATVLASVSLCAAAVLAPAPSAVVPLVALICVGCPIFASWEVPVAIAKLRDDRGHKALATLRKSLDQLPEIEHPLGL